MPDASTDDRGPLLAGIDLGTTNIKAVIYKPDGRSVAHATIPTVTHYPQPLWAYYEPEAMWQSAATVLREATSQLDDPSRVASIAVASVGETGILVDRDGNATYDAIAWFDRRTIPQAEWLAEYVGIDEIFKLTGMSLQPIFSLCKLMWLRENHPDVWKRSVRWLMAADFIAWKLSGAAATDHSLGARTMALNIFDLDWDEDLLRAARVDPSMMAPALESGTAIGIVTSDAARATGLSPGTTVSTGGHDHVCGSFAAGAVSPGRMVDSMGTAEALFLPLDRPITDLRFGEQGFSQGAHVVPGKYYAFGGVYTSSACVEWLRDIFDHADYDVLIHDASEVPPGSLGTMFLPHLRLGNAPKADPKSRAAFLGLTSDVTRGALVRSMYEGVAFEARMAITPILDFAELDSFPAVTVIGGGSKNDLLLHIKASVFNQPLDVLDLDEATALGAAMLGGIGAGIYASVDDALDHVQMHPSRIEPDSENVALYESLYSDIYQHLYDTLRPVNHAIHDLMVDPDEHPHL